MSIVAEAPGYLQVFSDGSVKRFASEAVPDSAESYSDGFKFKDVVIDSSKPITARLFVPDTQGSVSQLPVVVYFHGGGFCICSTTWLGFHHFLGDFSVASQSIVLSVDYRLAPENRLPIAYDDCFRSLEWLSNNVSSEPWLKQADLSRVFLSGDSAGGNITHQVAIRAVRSKTYQVEIKGLMLIHPYFGSEKRTKKEMSEGAPGDVAMNDMFWGLSIPEGSNRDYFGCNFEMQDVSAAEWSAFPAVAVYVAGLDFLNERGVMYAQFLAKKGVKEVTLVEAAGQNHVFHVFYPKSEATLVLQQQMKIPGILRVFSDGLEKRFALGIVPASSKSYSNGFKFKDVTIDSSKNITARLSLPDTPDSMMQLPVVVHFHGGCFRFCSTTWLGFHHFLGGLSVASQSIVLSVDYRLAPENRLPIGYDDCFSSLECLCNNASSDPWHIKQADLSPIVSFWRWCWMKHNTPGCN